MMNLNPLTDAERAQLIDLAQRAFEKAYAPYSKFRVGAAVLTAKGNTFPGCNVENVSYGLTICAERVAIFNAVISEGSEMKIRALAVANEPGIECSPCGACRQVIAQFGKTATILFQGPKGMEETTTADLLPRAFESCE